jgi:hypothetical protein
VLTRSLTPLKGVGAIVIATPSSMRVSDTRVAVRVQ